jgi:hypothetical protein
MLLKPFLFLVSFCLCLFTFSQHFNKIKNQEIVFDSFSEEHLDTLLSNTYSFIGEDFDSLDLQILFNGSVIGALSIKSTSKTDSFTYGDLYNEFLKMKSIPEYPQIKQKFIVTKELLKRPADINNWEKDKPLFMEIGFEGDQLEALRLYIKENSNSHDSYETQLIGFREQIEKQNQEDRKKAKKEAQKLFNSSDTFDEAELIRQSKNENKPILLYFTGYANVNCRKMEEFVLFDPIVSRTILDKYIFVTLYIDDKTDLPEERKKTIQLNGHNKELISVGDENKFFLESKFNVTISPYFVVLNADNKVLGTADYNSRDAKQYLLFLNEALGKFSDEK